MAEILLDKKFYREAEKKFREAVRHDPDWQNVLGLPKRWDFHKQKVYLTRSQMNALQIELSKMDKAKVKEQIKILRQMENERLTQVKEIDKALIAMPNDEKMMQDIYKWAFYCREARKFAEYYLGSLEYQKKI